MKAKRKGTEFERKVAKEIRRSGLDDSARRRPMSGAEKMMGGYADMITKLPYSFELKKQETMKFWQWWEQAESEANMSRPPVLVHSSNYRPIMCSMKFSTFLDLIKEKDEYKAKAKALENS